jgi:hypothetical protein
VGSIIRQQIQYETKRTSKNDAIDVRFFFLKQTKNTLSSIVSTLSTVVPSHCIMSTEQLQTTQFRQDAGLRTCLERWP